MEGIEEYRKVELRYKQKCKQRLESQYKVVKPDATQEDVSVFVDDDDGGRSFSQTVSVSSIYLDLSCGSLTRLLQFLDANRDGKYQVAYQEVQERHKDIKKIERTLHELKPLFDDACRSYLTYSPSFLHLCRRIIWSNNGTKQAMRFNVVQAVWKRAKATTLAQPTLIRLSGKDGFSVPSFPVCSSPLLPSSLLQSL